MTPLQNQQLIYCIMMAYDFFRDEKKVELWMKFYNPILCNAPIVVIGQDHGHKVISFMENARSENEN